MKQKIELKLRPTQMPVFLPYTRRLLTLIFIVYLRLVFFAIFGQELLKIRSLS
jgi:hypothetical protein